MNRRLHTASIIVLAAASLFLVAACGGGAAPDNTKAGAEEQKTGEQAKGGGKPDCGQGKVLGEASKTYDNQTACGNDRNNLQDGAKQDANAKCKSLCTSLSEMCEPKPVQAAPVVEGPDCNKVQDNNKVRARATALLDCVCQPK
ncbi:MAG: hypothetical protein LC795_03905 [Acidobacteria bacterium]|nr:hypothetical protein [Acidobacteriota bacterium]